MKSANGFREPERAELDHPQPANVPRHRRERVLGLVLEVEPLDPDLLGRAQDRVVIDLPGSDRDLRRGGSERSGACRNRNWGSRRTFTAITLAALSAASEIRASRASLASLAR